MAEGIYLCYGEIDALVFVIAARTVRAAASEIFTTAPPAFITAVSMTMIPIRAITAPSSIIRTAAELAM